MGSGKGWSQLETKNACRAYVVASEDPTKGTSRKKDAFTAAVLEEYKNLMNNEKQSDGVRYVDRTGDAICQRFRKARCECLKFEAFIKQINNRNPTGSPTSDDIKRTALAIYNGEGTIGTMYTYIQGRTLDVGPEFPFMEALSFLRATHTWNLLLQSQQVCKNNAESRRALVAHTTAQPVGASTTFTSPTNSVSVIQDGESIEPNEDGSA